MKKKKKNENNEIMVNDNKINNGRRKHVMKNKMAKMKWHKVNGKIFIFNF